MPASLVDTESILSVDVGTVATRAILFDVVDGRYRFLASGQAPSTAVAPFKNIGEGVQRAIEQLQMVTGRVLVDEQQRVIIPARDGAGVDAFAVTMSAGPVIKTVVVGLLNDVSLESAQRLARSTYSRVVEVIGLNDRRKAEEQIDGILRHQPDLIVIAGGTDDGASRSVQRITELTGLACYLLPNEKRPAVLYAGNQKIAKMVKDKLGPWTSTLSVSPNIRPSLEVEDLQAAQFTLTQLYAHLRRNRIGGVEDMINLAGGNFLPTCYAYSRMIRFLSEIYDSKKGILGVDLGASAATVAAGFGGLLTLGVHTHLGMGEGLSNLLRYTNLDAIVRWLSLDIPTDVVRDYIYNKSIYPTSLPATAESLAIEQALARQNLYMAMAATSRDFPVSVSRPSPDRMPYFEPILASGGALTAAPTLGQSLMMLLDGIQPSGVTTFILDQNNLLPALGAAASHNTYLPIQVLESGAFMGLATVVSPVVDARPGVPILRLRLVTKNGGENRLEVKQGALEILPLPSGQSGRLYLQPLHHADVGFGPGRGGELPVSGTALGVVVDARGRPLQLPVDHIRRRELLKKWSWTLGS